MDERALLAQMLQRRPFQRSDLPAFAWQGQGLTGEAKPFASDASAETKANLDRFFKPSAMPNTLRDPGAQRAPELPSDRQEGVRGDLAGLGENYLGMTPRQANVVFGASKEAGPISLADVTPFVGTGIAAASSAQKAGEGDYAGAAGEALGALPLIGATGRGLAKTGKAMPAVAAAAGATAAPSDAEAGWLLGPKARGIDKSAMTEAERMLKTGEHPRWTYDKTGWFRDPGGHMRTEVPATLNLPDWMRHMGTSTGNMPIKAKELDTNLFGYYPELADVPMAIDRSQPVGKPTGGWSGSAPHKIFADARLPEELRRTLAHELQHGGQQIEGVSGGSWVRRGLKLPSPQAMRVLDDMVKNNENLSLTSPLAVNAMQGGKSNLGPATAQNLRDSLEFETYLRNMGEAEARNAAHRLDFDANAIRERPWWVTQDREPRQLWQENPAGRLQFMPPFKP